MRVGLIDVDGGRFPNLALMKISAWHKSRGDEVEFVEPLYWDYDRVYQSKIFSFSKDTDRVFDCEVIKGGTGYSLTATLPKEIDCMQPDYSIYPQVDSKTAYGFITRGCPNNCPWCVVPQKEGRLKPYMDVEEIAIEGRNRLILMDNNILACDYGIEQIEKIVRNKYRVDFNQALDARRVTDEIARLLAKVRWIDYIRFGCDTPSQISECEKAIELIRKYGFTGRFFLYCMLNDDFNESFERIDYWHRKADWRIHPYAQPYRDPFAKSFPPGGNQTLQDGATEKRYTNLLDSENMSQRKGLDVYPTSIPQWQKDMAHWVNKHMIYRACDFQDFSPRKRFICKQYFV